MLWTKQIRWKKVLAGASGYTVIAFIVHQIEALATMGYYTDPQYFSVWSKLMMPAEGPPTAGFFVLSMLFSFITGVALASFYDFIRPLLPKQYIQKVYYFSDIVIGLMVVLMFLPMYLLINIPLGLQISWLLGGSVTVVLSAMVFARYMK